MFKMQQSDIDRASLSLQPYKGSFPTGTGVLQAAINLGISDHSTALKRYQKAFDLLFATFIEGNTFSIHNASTMTFNELSSALTNNKLKLNQSSLNAAKDLLTLFRDVHQNKYSEKKFRRDVLSIIDKFLLILSALNPLVKKARKISKAEAQLVSLIRLAMSDNVLTDDEKQLLVAEQARLKIPKQRADYLLQNYTSLPAGTAQVSPGADLKNQQDVKLTEYIYYVAASLLLIPISFLLLDFENRIVEGFMYILSVVQVLVLVYLFARKYRHVKEGMPALFSFKNADFVRFKKLALSTNFSLKKISLLSNYSIAFNWWFAFSFGCFSIYPVELGWKHLTGPLLLALAGVYLFVVNCLLYLIRVEIPRNKLIGYNIVFALVFLGFTYEAGWGHGWNQLSGPIGLATGSIWFPVISYILAFILPLPIIKSIDESWVYADVGIMGKVGLLSLCFISLKIYFTIQQHGESALETDPKRFCKFCNRGPNYLSLKDSKKENESSLWRFVNKDGSPDKRRKNNTYVTVYNFITEWSCKACGAISELETGRGEKMSLSSVIEKNTIIKKGDSNHVL